MKPGTFVRLPDGREGTTVYHGLDGYGIVWGRQVLDPAALPGPEAMLRDSYPSATVECVGEDYEVVTEHPPSLPRMTADAQHALDAAPAGGEAGLLAWKGHVLEVVPKLLVHLRAGGEGA